MANAQRVSLYVAHFGRIRAMFDVIHPVSQMPWLQGVQSQLLG